MLLGCSSLRKGQWSELMVAAMEWRWCGVSWGKFLQSDPCTGAVGLLDMLQGALVPVLLGGEVHYSQESIPLALQALDYHESL